MAIGHVIVMPPRATRPMPPFFPAWGQDVPQIRSQRAHNLVDPPRWRPPMTPAGRGDWWTVVFDLPVSGLPVLDHFFGPFGHLKPDEAPMRAHPMPAPLSTASVSWEGMGAPGQTSPPKNQRPERAGLPLPLLARGIDRGSCLHHKFITRAKPAQSSVGSTHLALVTTAVQESAGRTSLRTQAWRARRLQRSRRRWTSGPSATTR